MLDASKGFVTLLSVVVLGAIGLSITTSLLLFGAGSSHTSIVRMRSLQAKVFANACAEEALQKLRESVYYQGNETLIFSGGSCDIQSIPIGGIGNNGRTVQVIGKAGSVERRVRVIISTVHPTVLIASWQEIGTF